VENACESAKAAVWVLGLDLFIIKVHDARLPFDVLRVVGGEKHVELAGFQGSGFKGYSFRV
jgi:hypothetical protein